MPLDFLRSLSSFSKNLKKSFWLLGEIVAGDCRSLAQEGCLDSVTNYELYKSLWSSFHDKNIYELAWTLKREFAHNALYSDLALYNFADNHDVNRAASSLKSAANLFPLYGALFCAPGIPSIYYGSEYGVYGKRNEYDDYDLRPCWQEGWARLPTAKNLFTEICRFSKLRRESEALKSGSYRELLVNYDQVFAFARETRSEKIIVIINAADKENVCALNDKEIEGAKWLDLLSNDVLISHNNTMEVRLQPSWLRIMRKI